jgi:hypothetical protein
MVEKTDEFLASLDHAITVNIAAFNEHQEAAGSGIRMSRATTPTENEQATEITRLREACNIALGSLKALGAEKGYAAEMLRSALGTAHDGGKI